ncbi:uncharacterized protein LOC143573415 [Bidens hawaiensis]|uniref:uncharacterized protein LOC143573415 n=1 Tax=Bidens hawaiensis TaxID=980011 RepID=UPI004048FF27
MTPPMKQEPTENPPNIESQHTNWLPDIKPDTIEYPPSKRLKTLTPDPPSKGKSKAVNEEEEEDDDDNCLQQKQLATCGVCLLDEGLPLRGFIDSCDHYFCFVCIMEWAKVESRCPVCKRRFSVIRRPSSDGVFLSERIVNVPVRDQVYYYNGNATIGPQDPYSQVKCTVCSSSSDDHLLLLCDLCDSAAHSYCVGLGATVPEGDWFCRDCTLSRDEHAKVETYTTFDNDDDNNTNINTNTNTNINNNDNNNPFSRFNTGRVTYSEVSIHDIVRESYTREPDTDTDTDTDAPSVPTSDRPMGDRSNAQSTVDRSNAPNARTLKRCLNVHSRIRVLRENWNGFRGGSLTFTSSFGDVRKTSQSESQTTSQNRSNDIDKAWKMMSIAAKAFGKKPGNKNPFPKKAELHKNKERLVNEASKVRPNGSYFGGLRTNESEFSSSSRKIIDSAHVKNVSYNCQNLATASNVVGSSGQSSSIATDKRCAKRVVDATLEKKENIKKYTQLGSSGQSSSMATDKRSAKKAIDATLKKENINKDTQLGSSDQSSSKANDKHSAEKIDSSLEKEENINKDTQHDGNNNNKEIEDAKSEIQSLVKLNLKLLSKDKKLEADVFKEVARHATHSIMAACGIEPPKARFRSFERVVCDHSQTRKRPSSTLMPTSCRECFFTFVKDVVSTIAIDTTTSCKP